MKKQASTESTGKRKKVGTFHHRFEIAAVPDGPFREIDGLVDTGSLYSWVPASLLAQIKVKATEQLPFLMANGERVRRDAAEVVMRLDGRVRHTLCVFGGDKDLILLGALALEQFGLAADPMNKRLIPMESIPAAAAD